MMSPFEPPVFHFPVKNGSIIIAVDAQKSWEPVHNYTERIVHLLAMRRMTERYDSTFMLRVFLGGLREPILNDILANKMHDMKFRTIVEYAKLLEATSGYGDMTVAPVATPFSAQRSEPPRPFVEQDGLVIFGMPNEKVEVLYQRGPVRSALKILYRR